MTTTAELLHRAVALGQAGQLARAREAAEAAQRSVIHTTPLDQRFDVMLVSTRIVRHLGPEHVGLALGLARHTERLGRLLGDPTAMMRAQLEVAACQIAAGCDNATDGLVRLTEHTDPHIAARAWHLLGGAALKADRVFDAIAALLNAVAEQQRAGDQVHQFATRTALLLAFSRAGHLEDADRIAHEDAPSEAVGRRQWIEFLLARAEHAHRAGRIDHGLDLLNQVHKALEGTSGMDSARHRRHLLRAACLADWLQEDEAREALNQARNYVPRGGPDPSAAPRRGGSRDLPMGRQRRPAAPSSREPDPAAVERLVADLETIPSLELPHATAVCETLAGLAGRPGLERIEAILLLRAGTALSQKAQQDCRLIAERLLRRALVRLDYLEGADMWLAQCQVTLGKFLATHRCPEAQDEALDLLTRGIQGLDRERFRMVKRPYRARWLRTLEHGTFDQAIALAVACEQTALAADLITFSRLAGVPNPAAGRNLAGVPNPAAGRNLTSDELPLTAVPTLRYIDGTTSTLGSATTCHLL